MQWKPLIITVTCDPALQDPLNPRCEELTTVDAIAKEYNDANAAGAPPPPGTPPSPGWQLCPALGFGQLMSMGTATTGADTSSTMSSTFAATTAPTTLSVVSS